MNEAEVISKNSMDGGQRNTVFQAIALACIEEDTAGHKVWRKIAASAKYPHLSEAEINAVGGVVGHKWCAKSAAKLAALRVGFPVTVHNMKTAIKAQNITIYHAPGEKAVTKKERIAVLEADMAAVLFYLKNTDPQWRTGRVTLA